MRLMGVKALDNCVSGGGQKEGHSWGTQTLFLSYFSLIIVSSSFHTNNWKPTFARLCG